MDLPWLEMLLTNLKIKQTSPPTLHCHTDNVSAIAPSSPLRILFFTKHIDVDYRFVKEKVRRKQPQVCFVPSDVQLADLFTKSLPTTRFNLLPSKLLEEPPLSLRGEWQQDNYEYFIYVSRLIWRTRLPRWTMWFSKTYCSEQKMSWHGKIFSAVGDLVADKNGEFTLPGFFLLGKLLS